MKVSAQEEYGLRCMLMLARRQRQDGVDPVSLQEIARAEGLTVPNVAKLIRTLRRAGLVKSVLGRSGGYTLSREARAINVAEILAALGGRFYDTNYCGKHTGELDTCSHMGDCTIRSLWGVIGGLLDRVLGRTTLADLIGHEACMGATLATRTPLAIGGGGR
jgi:Rrf2 family protein